MERNTGPPATIQPEVRYPLLHCRTNQGTGIPGWSRLIPRTHTMASGDRSLTIQNPSTMQLLLTYRELSLRPARLVPSSRAARFIRGVERCNWYAQSNTTREGETDRTLNLA